MKRKKTRPAFRPPDESERALLQLARLHGVQPSYVDMAKRVRNASPASLLAVLRTLGVPVDQIHHAPDALRESRRALARRVLEPVQVVWSGKRADIPLRLPDGTPTGSLRSQWCLADGETFRFETRLERLVVARQKSVEGERFVTHLVPVPARLPVGYHGLVLECGNDRFETQIFCAPERCFQGSSRRRSWGLFAPLYALHGQGSWGAGDYGDLADFIRWVGEQGGGFVGTLPLLPAFLDRPCEPSPYSPVSRLFWNEFYLDLDQVPELETCLVARRSMQTPSFQKLLAGLRRGPLVDYAAQMALKRKVLETLSRSFFAKSSSRRRTFEKLLRAHPQWADYARFRAAHEERAVPWTKWPARMRGGELRDADCRQSLQQYHLYVQWLAHEQMTGLSNQARQQKVEIYQDMPLGTHRDGYDAWRYQEFFALDASGGAPPDPVFTRGQNWGFAPIHPQQSRAQGHAYLRAYLRHHLRHAQMLRFDHVMGLHRLYWVPQGLPASQGAYVNYPAEEYYAILSIESHRHGAIIIGENLGTVPAVVNQSLKRHGIAGLFVAQYEARPQPNSALRRIPADAVASLNTHDMPPFAAFWKGLDLADRRALGLIKRDDIGREYRRRRRICQSLLRFLRRRGRLEPGPATVETVFRALVEQLGDSEARWVLLNLEDLWLATASQNTPGTTTERVNWRRKAALGLEQLEENQPWMETLSELNRFRQGLGRRSDACG